MRSIEKFYSICDEIKMEWKSPNQIKEKYFVDALNTIKENEKNKAEILHYFANIMNGKIDMPPELIEFCMRELQWIEIKDLALKLIAKGDPRIQSTMEHIIEVYEREWEDADLYKYYSGEDNN